MYCGQCVDRTSGAIAHHSMQCEKHPVHSLMRVVAERDELKTTLLTVGKERDEWASRASKWLYVNDEQTFGTHLELHWC